MFTGLIPALLTPISKDGTVNQSMLVDLADYFIGLGFTGLYLCGSTGEGLLLSEDERKTVASTVVQAAKGRVPVIIHVGHTSSSVAESLAKHARECGADAIASIPPFYYSYTSQEISSYYRGLKKASNLPLFFYDIPAAVKTSLDIELARELFSAGIIQGMKYTNHDVLTLTGIMDACQGKLNVLSGPDEKLLPYLVLGVDGGIGTTYNCMPKLMLAVYASWKVGDLERANRLQFQANRIILVLAKYGIIPALKAIMRLQGKDCGDPRRPFLPLNEIQVNNLRQDLDNIGFFDMERNFDL